LDNYKTIQTFNARGNVLGARWNPECDNILMTSTADRRMVWLDKRTNKPIKILLQSGPINNFEWSHDGSLFSVCTQDSIQIWNYYNMSRMFHYANGISLPGKLQSFDRHNRYLAILKEMGNRHPTIIDLNHMNFVDCNYKLEHSAPITCMEWNDSLLATGSRDREVLSWEIMS